MHEQGYPQKIWKFKPLPSPALVRSLAEAIQTGPIVSNLLAQRGIYTYDDAKSYFRPSLSHIFDPFQLRDMDKAVERVCRSVEENEAILVYGDYDVDGTTAVAMFYDFLLQLGARVSFYTPDRYTEGYGLSMQAVTWAASQGFGLIITLDCGIRAHGCIDEANALGIDVVVCDHHEPADTLPESYAILNPKRADCKYPFKELSGCGVGWKLLHAISLHRGLPEITWNQYLDLVAISIIADIVPITEENRILTYHGLQRLNASPRPGLKAMIDIANLRTPLTVSQVVFGIAPRINAAGRIEHAKLAVSLLLAPDVVTASELAQQINQQNAYRKDLDGLMTEEALAMIESDLAYMQAKTTVLFKETWHKGVLGIVASRCIEHYYRPTIILTASQGKATGSVRSVAGYNVYEALQACAPLLEQYGGHAHAAGLTLTLDNIGAFRQRFEAVVAANIGPEQLVPVQNIDLHISLTDINQRVYNVIAQMAPFGPGNQAPIFASENLVAIRWRVLKDTHLKLYIQHITGGPLLEAIGFGLAALAPWVSEGKPFKMAYVIEQNDYLGNKSLQLNIKDIRPM